MLPWQISALDLDEKKTMESLGLLKAYLTLDMSSPDSGSHFLLFPSSFDSTEEEGLIPCSLQSWKERESLAYYLNHHILGHGRLLPDASIPKAISAVLRKNWVPGKHIATAGFTGINQGTPYIKMDSIYLLPLEDNRLREIGDGDILGSRKDFVWEIYTESINGVLYLQGQSVWTTWFKKALLPKWRNLATEVQKACSLQLIDIWHRDAPSPNVVWICFHR
jgi:hypothetical protein